MVAKSEDDPRNGDDWLIEAARELAAEVREASSVGSGPAAPDIAVDAFRGYRILHEIHRGGQGVVYQAIQEGTHRRVAIKVLRAAAEENERERARFEREVRILAALDHPNIVTVHESGREADRLFLVMDYIPGWALDVFAASGARSVRETLALFQRIAEAVEAAHVRGILHRDLKPSNIRIDPDGEPHVLDFGLAKEPGEVGAASEVTVSGQFVGSLPWASPEQTEGSPELMDIRSDVYSLGVILFQVLTSRFPYEVVGNVADVVENIRSAEPLAPSSLRGEVDEDVDTIVLRCLQKDRARRYQGAGDLARDVAAYLAGEPIQARRDSTMYVLRKTLRRHRGPVAVGAAVVALVTVGLAVSLFLLREVSAERDRTRTAQNETEAARGELELHHDELRASDYFRRVQLAQYALAEDNTGRAKSLLESCPDDLRGWEWSHLAWCADRSERVLRGHGDTVNDLAFGPDPDELWLASAGEDGTVRLWHAPTGYESHVLPGHGGAVECLAFHPGGARLASGGADGTVRLWDTAAGTQLAVLASSSQPIVAVAFTLDGTSIVVASGTELWIVDASSGDRCVEIVLDAEITAVACAPNDGAVLVGTAEGAVGRWDAAGSGDWTEVCREDATIRALAVRADGRELATGSLDGVVRTFSLPDGALAHELRGHGTWVYAVDYDPYGRYLLSTGADHTARVWDVERGELRKALRGHEDRIYSAAFGPDGAHVATGSRDGTARLWKISAEETSRVFVGHRDIATAVAFDATGERIATTSSDETARIWLARDEKVLPLTFAVDAGPAMDVAFAADGHQAVTAHGDGVVRIWDPASGQLLRAFEAHEGGVLRLDVDAERERLATSGLDRVVRLWDLKSGECLATLDTGKVYALDIDPAGGRVACGTTEAELQVWDVATGERLATGSDGTWGIFGVAWSPDGSSIATGSMDARVRVWAPDARLLARLDGHRDGVRCVAYAPDGQRIATGGWDATVRIWDARSGALAATLRGHGGRVNEVDFAPDGRRLASVSVDGDLRVWETDSRR